MRVNPDRLSILMQHGLSENEARVYLALLDVPELNAGALAKVTHIPRNRLYEILGALQEADLVEIHLDTTTRKYRAVPFRRFLDRREAELKARLLAIAEEKEALADLLEPPPADRGASFTVGTTRIVLGRRAVARELGRMLDDARTSVVAVSSAGGHARAIRYLAPHAERALGDPPLHVEVYLSRAAAADDVFRRHAETLFQGVRWADVPGAAMTFIIDERELLLVHPLPDDGSPLVGRDFALYTTNPAFVADRLDLIRAALGGRPAVWPGATP